MIFLEFMTLNGGYLLKQIQWLEYDFQYPGGCAVVTYEFTATLSTELQTWFGPRITKRGEKHYGIMELNHWQRLAMLKTDFLTEAEWTKLMAKYV